VSGLSVLPLSLWLTFRIALVSCMAWLLLLIAR
jgi:hypothetical protein